MARCKYCGSPIGDGWDECDGRLTFDVDPYQSEINDNHEKSWDCEGNRFQSRMDI